MLLWLLAAFAVAIVLRIAAAGYVLCRRARKIVHHVQPRPTTFAAKVRHPSLAMPAVDIAARIRDGEFTSVEVVSAFVEAVKRVNGRLNAVCHTVFERALEEAAVADRCVASGDATEWFEAVGAPPGRALPPFLGVPVTIKECFGMEGLPQTSGHPGRLSCVASSDATAVARLREAGMVCLVTTNLSQLCMWYESSNPVYGRTNNPYNVDRVVGGSSGGEGSLLGAGASVVGLGSDVGGSIRMPAAFNGVFGLKPSGGTVPNTGQYPCAQTSILCTGPLTRYSKDLWPVLRVVAGPDGVDPVCKPVTLSCGSPSCVPGHGRAAWACASCFRPTALPTLPPKLKVYVLETRPMLTVAVHPDIQAGIKAAAAALQRAGEDVEVLPLALDEMARAAELWSSALALSGAPRFRDLLEQHDGQKKPLVIMWELAKWFIGATTHTFPALCLAGIEDLPGNLMPQRQADAAAAADAVADRLRAMLGSDAVLLCPTHPTPPPAHDVPMLPTRIFGFAYTSFWNAMRLAVASVPTGLTAKEHLPCAVSVVCADNRLCTVCAEHLEAELGGWVPPDTAME